MGLKQHLLIFKKIKILFQKKSENKINFISYLKFINLNFIKICLNFILMNLNFFKIYLFQKSLETNNFFRFFLQNGKYIYFIIALIRIPFS